MSAQTDNTPPVITVVSPDTTAATEKIVSASINEAGTINYYQTSTTCSLDKADYINTYSAAITLNSESDNLDYICFFAEDTVGNTSTATSNQIQGIDRTGPSISIVNANALPEQSKTYTASASDAVSIQHTFESTNVCPPSPTSPIDGSNVVVSTEARNDQYICFYATDALGNSTNKASAQITKIDTTAPVATVSLSANTQSSGFVREGSIITATVSVTEINGLNISSAITRLITIGGVTVTPTITEIDDDYTDLGGQFSFAIPSGANGAVEVKVNGFTDTAGNQAAEGSGSLTESTDTTKPVLTEVELVTSIPDAGDRKVINTPTPTYKFNSTEIGTITYSGGCSSTDISAQLTNTIVLNTLQPGIYSNCSLTVTDTAGNVSLPLNISPFIYDVTAPSVVVTLQTNDGDRFVKQGDTVTATIAVTDNVAVKDTQSISAEILINNSVTSITTTETDSNYADGEGQLTFTIPANVNGQVVLRIDDIEDSAGNSQETSSTSTTDVLADTTPPTVALSLTSTNPSLVTAGDEVFVTITITDVSGVSSSSTLVRSATIGGTTISPTYTDTDSDYTDGTGAYKFTVPAAVNGEISVTVNGFIDVSGNTQATPITQALSAQTDNTPPVITVVSPDTTAATEKIVSASINEAGTINYYQTSTTCSLDKADYINTYSAAITLNSESDNLDYICFFAEDTVGNTSTATSNQIQGIDRTGPSISIVNANALPEQSKTYTASASDAVSIQHTFESTNVCPPSPTSPIDGSNVVVSTEARNDQYICFYATDALGNSTSKASAQITKIDTTAPVVAVSLSSPDSGGFVSAGDTVVVDVSITEINGLNTSSTITRLITIGGVTVTPTITEIDDDYTDLGGQFSFAIPADQDGQVEVSISGFVDVAGNASVISLGALNAISDTTKPTLSAINLVPSVGTKGTYTIVNTGTLTFTFNSDEAGTITYIDDRCTSSTARAIVGNNTIVLNSISSGGTYEGCTLSVTDNAGNVSDPITIFPFIYDTTKPTVSINISTTDGDLFARAGDIVTASVSVEEEVLLSSNLNLARTITIGSTVVSSAITDIDNDYSDGSGEFTFAVPNTASGRIIVSISGFVDIAGNIADAATTTSDLQVDILPPIVAVTLESNNPTASYATEGDVITVSIATTDPSGIATSSIISKTITIGGVVETISITEIDTDYSDGSGQFSFALPANKDGVISVSINGFVDNAGNAQTIPSVNTLSVEADSTSPVLVITNPDTSTAQNKLILANVTNETGATIEFIKTSDSTCPASIPVSTTPYPSGGVSLSEVDNNRYVCFYATDKAGNISSGISNQIIGLDTTAPTFTLNTIAVDGIVNLLEKTSGILISGSTEASSNVSVTIEGVSKTSVATIAGEFSIEFEFDDLPSVDNNDIDVVVSVSDAVGNSSEQTVQIDIDTTIPAITSFSIARYTNDTSPDYTFISNEAGVIEYKLGVCDSADKSVSNGTNTITLNTLIEGEYTNCSFAVEDNAGNLSQIEQFGTFEIDTTAPNNPTIDTEDGGEFINTDERAAGVNIAGNTDLNTTVKATIDGTEVSGTVLSTRYSVLLEDDDLPDSDGIFSLVITSTDRAGNSSSVSKDIEINTQPPSLSLTDEYDDVDEIHINTLTARFTYVSSEPGTLLTPLGDCSVDSTAAITGNNTVTFTFADRDGEQTCSISARDNAGNISNSLTLPKFIIDRIAPSVVFTENPNNISAQSKTVSVTTEPSTRTFIHTLTTAITCPTAIPQEAVEGNSITFTAESDNGSYVCIYSQDTAENLTVVRSNQISGIDTTSPLLNITSPVNNALVNRLQRTAGITIVGEIELGSAISISTPTLTTNLRPTGTALNATLNSADAGIPENGDVAVTITATDAAGNVSTVVRTITTDSIDPVITITPLNTVIIREKQVSATSSEVSPSDGAFYKAINNGDLCSTLIPSDAIAYTLGEDISINSESFNGQRICFYVTDNAGNISASESDVIVGIDRTLPSISTTLLEGYTVNRQDRDDDGITVSGSVEAFASVSIELDSVTKTIDSANTATGSYQVTYATNELPNSDGEYTLTISAVDRAGNNNSITRTVRFSLNSPSLTLLTPEILSISNNNTPVLNFRTDEGGVLTIRGKCSVNNVATSTVVAGDLTYTFNTLADKQLPTDSYDDCSITITDVDGNVSVPLSIGAFEIDTVNPIVSIQTIAGNDIVNSIERNAGVDIVVDTEAGVDVSVTLGGTTKVVSDLTGTTAIVSFTASEIPFDALGVSLASTVTAIATDSAGNVSSIDRPITIDIDPPAISVSSVTGDDVINVLERGIGVAISGTTEATAEVSVTFEGVTKTTTSLDGTYSVIFATDDIPVEIDPNSTISILSTDVNGNTKGISKDVSIATVPLTLSVVGDGILSLINNTTPSLTILSNSDGTLAYLGCSASINSISNATNLLITLDELTEDRAYNCSITLTDFALNTTVLSLPEFTLDTTAPVVSIGIVEGDNVINASEKTAGISIFGTTEANVSVSISFGGLVKTTVSDPQGVYSIGFATAEIPVDGNYDVSVIATDQIGNSHTEVASGISVDTLSPVISSVSTVPPFSNNLTLPYEFTSTEAGPISIVGGCSFDIAVAVANANSTNISVPNDGVYACSFVISDLAGNPSLPLNIPNFEIDRTPPSIVTISNIASDDVINSVEKVSGVTVSGVSDIGTTVSITLDGVLKTQTLSTVDYAVSFTESEIPSDGRYVVSARSTDAAGNFIDSTKGITIDTIGITSSIVGDIPVDVRTGRTSFNIPFNYNNNSVDTILVSISGAENCGLALVADKTGSSISEVSEEFVILGENDSYLNCSVTFTDTALNQTTFGLADFNIQSSSGGAVPPGVFTPIGEQNFSLSSSSGGSRAVSYSIGDDEPIIATLKSIINTTECRISDGDLSSTYTASTQEAVRCFQSSRGVEVTGIIDEDTADQIVAELIIRIIAVVRQLIQDEIDKLGDEAFRSIEEEIEEIESEETFFDSFTV